MARRLLAITALLACAVAVAAIGLRVPAPEPPRVEVRIPPAPSPTATPARKPPPPRTPRIAWRASTPLGVHTNGRLLRSVRLPSHGRHFVTWDPVLKRTPNRGWRRNGTDDLVRLLLRVASAYARAHPGAPRLVIGDLSRPHGGDFGRRYGPLGHISHQNGLDADVYLPRKDRRELAPRRPNQVDRRLAQDLLDRFVRAGAQLVLVGRGLRGPKGVVQWYPNHEDHLHVRLRKPVERGAQE